MTGILQASWHGGPPGRQWSIRNPDGTWTSPTTLVSGQEGDSCLINGVAYLCYGQKLVSPTVAEADIMFIPWSAGAVPIITGLKVGRSQYGNQSRVHAFSPQDPAHPNRVLLAFTPYNSEQFRFVHLGRSDNLGATWTDVGILPTLGALPAADMHNPYGVVRSDGVVRIYWQAYDPVGSPHYTIYFVESTDHGQTFGSEQLVAYPGGITSSSRPTICEDRTAGVPNGKLYVYTSHGTANSTLDGWKAETSSPGSAVVVVPNDGLTHFAGSITWDGTQFVLVYQSDNASGNHSIRTATAPSLGGPWTLAEVVRSGNPTGVDPTIQFLVGAPPPPPPSEARMRLEILAEDGQTTELDLTAQNRGEEYGFGIHGDWNPGSVPMTGSAELQQKPTPGAIRVNASPDLAHMSGRLLFRAANMVDFQTNLRLLARLLSEDRVWLHQLEGQDEAVYFDTLAATELPSFLRGVTDKDLLLIQRYLEDAPGLPISVDRQPYGRLAERPAYASATLGNNSGQRTMTIDIEGNMPALLRVHVQPVGAAKLVQARIAARDVGNLSEYTDAPLYSTQLEAGSLTNGTTIVGDSSASGSSLARTAFGTTKKDMVIRVRRTVVPTDESALEGTFQSRPRVRPSLGQILTISPRTSMAQVSPAVHTLPSVVIDTNGLSAQKWFELPLGLVDFDRLGDRLVIEYWASTDTDNATMDWDLGILEPADSRTVEMAERGFYGAHDGYDKWLRASLIVPTSIARPSTGGTNGPANPASDTTFGDIPVVGGGYTDEALATPPMTLDVGHHRFTLLGASIQNNHKTAIELAELRIRKVSGTPADLFHVDLKSVKNVQYGPPGTSPASIEFDVTDSTVLYQIQQVMTAQRDPSSGPASIKYSSGDIEHTFSRATLNPDAMVLDAITGRAYVEDPDGVLQHVLLAPIGFLEAGPGPVAFQHFFGTEPVAGMEGIDARGPLAVSSLDDSYLVWYDVVPRVAPH